MQSRKQTIETCFDAVRWVKAKHPYLEVTVDSIWGFRKIYRIYGWQKHFSIYLQCSHKPLPEEIEGYPHFVHQLIRFSETKNLLGTIPGPYRPEALQYLSRKGFGGLREFALKKSVQSGAATPLFYRKLIHHLRVAKGMVFATETEAMALGRANLLKAAGCLCSKSALKLINKLDLRLIQWAFFLRNNPLLYALKYPNFIKAYQHCQWITRENFMLFRLSLFGVNDKIFSALFQYPPEIKETLLALSNQLIKTDAEAFASICTSSKDFASLYRALKASAEAGRYVRFESPPLSAITGITPLCDTYDMAQEGEKMHHCVGKHSKLSANVYFYHINSGGVQLTLKIVFNEKKQMWEKKELKGVCNASPRPQDAQLVTDWLNASEHHPPEGGVDYGPLEEEWYRVCRVIL